MSTALSTEHLDTIAAQVIAGIEQEAASTAAQPFFEAMMAEVEKRAPHARRYTGAELFLREPVKFRAVVSYLAEGRGQLWIADRAACSHHTVRAIRDHFPKAVAIEKERLADRCQTAAGLLVDRIIENPESLPPQSLGVTAGILMDKALLLRGGATIITEHRRTFSHEDFNSLLKEGAIEVASTVTRMDSTGEEAAQMGSPAAPAPSGHDQDAGPALMDSESLGSQRKRPAATLPATLAERPDPGEGGVAPAQAGGAPDEG